MIEIFGVPFKIEIDNSGLTLTHPRWSLMGEGGKLIDAEVSLIYEAQNLYDDYKDVSGITIEGLELRDFIIQARAVVRRVGDDIFTQTEER
jgi:hypothetical protein